MKGGHARSGPPPDPSALRRDRSTDAAWITLPASGRSGEPPEWPLGEQTEREAHLWKHFWAKPQAIEWERLGQVHEVAVYVRRLTEAEVRNAPVAVGTLVKQLGEQLGLTIPGMRMHRWKIGNVAEPAKKAAAAKPARQSSRERFRVIDGDAS